MTEMFAGYAGVYGDRLFAFKSSATRKGFPFFTGREQRQMIRYRPRFRNSNKAARPVDLADAESLPPGVNPLSAHPAELMIDVETPDGKTIAIDDPSLIDHLRTNIDEKHQLTLRRSDKAMTDCRPCRSSQSNRPENLAKKPALPSTSGASGQTSIWILVEGFAEDEFVGRSIRIGPKVVVSILERDPRCMMITLDPDTRRKRAGHTEEKSRKPIAAWPVFTARSLWKAWCTKATRSN